MKRILVVEDDSSLREFLRVAFTRCGFSVVAVSNGLQALQHATKSPDSVDLVLSDVSMPGLDGFGLAEKLKNLAPKLSVVLMSSYEKPRTKEQGFLRKPFTLAQAMDVVHAKLPA